ncbi:MAG TPA: protease HtpX [Usitatibacter sp.]|jgi:heat shock protein HtpX|nr:protease HtpX [Usitatibacter sp.]
MKRVTLYILTNLAVMVVLGVVLEITGANRFFAASGLNIPALLLFSAIVGFTGSIFSLLISKQVAKWSTGMRMLDPPQSADEQWLVATVKSLAEHAGVAMPEVGIYEGEPNAFATGAFRDSSLVAVSTGLLQSMSHDEVEAVLGHEIGHVANGDMVTLTLIQGVVNTFVVFLSRVVGYLVDKAVFKTERGVGMGYYLTVMVCQIVFGVLASIIVAWFSRRREFRADAASAGLLGSPRPMISALRRLGGLQPGALPQSLQAFGIAEGDNKFMALFASHPPIAARIAALENQRPGQA